MTPQSLIQSVTHPLLGPIVVPLVAAGACALLPDGWARLRVAITVLAAAVTGWLVAQPWLGSSDVLPATGLAADPLSSLCALGAAAATFLVAVFMLGWSTAPPRRGHRLLLASTCATLGTANGVFFADSLLTLLVAWGTLAVLLYLMIAAAGPRAAGAARKATLIVGGADAALLLGVVLLAGTGLPEAPVAEALGESTGLAFAACMVAGLAKVGAAPLHGWVAPCAARAHGPAAALLLGAVDKLVGGYLLFRLLGDRSSASLMVVGGISIAVGMLLAVTERDAKRLLGYSSVAQIGFVLLGLGSGTAIGRAGALFHLINNVLYKPALFTTTAAVEARTGTSDLAALGGLARTMPGTFAATLVCGLALAGVPPFNGFFSKWMIYQGLFAARGTGGSGWALGLLVAMVGSALTLAAVAKLVHATYLRRATVEPKRPGPAPSRWRAVAMTAPALVAAFASVGLGLFAEQAVLQPLVYPATAGEITYAGTWWSGTAALLLAAAIGAGALSYWGSLAKLRRTATYVGGEDLSRVYTTGVPPAPNRDVEVSGADFFETLRRIGGLRRLFAAVERGWLDAEHLIAQLLRGPIALSRHAHRGLVSAYALWIVLGLCALLVGLGGVR